MKHKRNIDIANECLSAGRKQGVVQLTTEDTALDGRLITINGKSLINFGSCSYLGLEQHPNLKKAGIEAIQQYGSQFSCSRAYLSISLYQQLESLLSQMFNAPVVVAPSTTLAHLGALPSIIEPDDIVFLDQFVHASVQVAANQLAAAGNKLNIIRHGRLDILEEKLKALSHLGKKIWFMADGVYSMFGGFADIAKLKLLLAKYKMLHLYIDDAHGMSWCGKNGTGSVWYQLANHERLYLAVSFAKAFAAGGGALVLPNEDILWKIRSSGSTFIFSGPIQPPTLGAGVASAKIHLSDEIKLRQADLMTKLQAAKQFSRELDLPAITKDRVPIQYIGVSHRDATFDLVHRLMDKGFYVNAAFFPAVNSRHSGLRFNIHHHLQLDDIHALFTAIAEELPKVLTKYGISRQQLDDAFTLKSKKRSNAKAVDQAHKKFQPDTQRFELVHTNSIASIDQQAWDNALGQRGNFNAKTLLNIEKAFSNQTDPINDWTFHYFMIKDNSGKLLLATFFTEALWKTDMLTAEAKVSEAIEAERKKDPLYLTAIALAMGSPITEGNHLYIDMDNHWQELLLMLLNRLETIRQEKTITSVVFRDIDEQQETLINFLKGFDFLELSLPTSWKITIDWQNEEHYLQHLSSTQRRFQKYKVKPFEEIWHLNVLHKDNISENDWQRIHQLYRNVQERQLTLNSFQLPLDFFKCMLENPEWEIWTLSLENTKEFQGFSLCQKNDKSYNWLILGMDYNYVLTHGLYRQILAKAINRGKQLGCKEVNLGLGTNYEKSRHGAKPHKIVMLAQSFDQYQSELITMHRVNQSFKKA